MQANILELTGRRPRLEAGRRLRAIAAALARVKDRDSATAWLVSYSRWEQDFASFLDEGLAANAMTDERLERRTHILAYNP